jgi:hypothetical protein
LPYEVEKVSKLPTQNGRRESGGGEGGGDGGKGCEQASPEIVRPGPFATRPAFDDLQ